MLLRVSKIVLLALLLSLVFCGVPLATQPSVAGSLVLLSPPAGLELPAGQGLEVRCRLAGVAENAVVELAVDGVAMHRVEILAGGEASLPWVPARAGRSTLTVVATPRGKGALSAERSVLVLPAGSPVRVR